MAPLAFTDLCEILVRDGGLRPTLQVTIEKQVAKTLNLLAYNVTNRELSFIFRRSGEFASRHFHVVLRVILGLYEKFIKQPDGSHVPSEIASNQRFYPCFKDCIDAIDGTHIRIKVSQHESPKYRGRKDYPTQNVLAACTFDLKFTYVLAGWEGTTSDSRIMKEALNSQDSLKIPEGKFYLVDAGLILRSGLITPYREEQYHLKEYSRNSPRNFHELFNLRHASLCNAIERAFGVLKKRFPRISSSTESSYGIETQKLIIFVCCLLHNYLRGANPNDELIAQADAELMNNNNVHEEAPNSRESNEKFRMGELIRDGIAAAMWTNNQD
ncbi:protein ALP1-like [Capsicum annuum]|uniref:protein ALP1-like n=1 Tax=Capsicum annuum TaxID=4072 RepID=UPI001FB0927B|nr:protein ALP1-like [Capsicum annuum]